MCKLIYSMSVSLDGYICGPQGEFDWSVPDEELHRFHNGQVRELGGHLLGRAVSPAIHGRRRVEAVGLRPDINVSPSIASRSGCTSTVYEHSLCAGRAGFTGREQWDRRGGRLVGVPNILSSKDSDPFRDLRTLGLMSVTRRAASGRSPPRTPALESSRHGDASQLGSRCAVSG